MAYMLGIEIAFTEIPLEMLYLNGYAYLVY